MGLTIVIVVNHPEDDNPPALLLRKSGLRHPLFVGPAGLEPTANRDHPLARPEATSDRLPQSFKRGIILPTMEMGTY